MGRPFRKIEPKSAANGTDIRKAFNDCEKAFQTSIACYFVAAMLLNWTYIPFQSCQVAHHPANLHVGELEPVVAIP